MLAKAVEAQKTKRPKGRLVVLLCYQVGRHSLGRYLAVMAEEQTQRSWPEPTSVGVRMIVPGALGTVEVAVTTPRPSFETVMPDTYLVAPGNT